MTYHLIKQELPQFKTLTACGKKLDLRHHYSGDETDFLNIPKHARCDKCEKALISRKCRIAQLKMEGQIRLGNIAQD